MMGGPTPPGRSHQDLTASAETEHYLRGGPGTVQVLPPGGSVVSESTRPCPSPRDAAGARWAAALAEHEPLVHWVVRRQHLGPLSYLDAVHEGRIGLWRALRRYDPARGTRFSSYAVPAITRAVWAAVAREQAGTGPADGVAVAVVPVHEGDPADRLHEVWVRRVLGELVAQLPVPQRQVVVAHLGLYGRPPQTFAAIAPGLGVTRQRVHQVYWDAVDALAHPARSLLLRRLLERATRGDYQQTLARQQRRARARRRPSGRPR